MSEPSDNGKLIEEARTWAALIGTDPRGARDLFHRLADALEAAEKAHTPTDGERGALATAVLEASVWPEKVMRAPSGSEFAFVDRLLASGVWGFRHTEVPEPTAEDQGPAANCAYCVGAGGYEDHDGTWVECSCQRPEPQGEPSDAQVDAARRAWMAAYRREPRERMRAALRAAGGVR